MSRPKAIALILLAFVAALTFGRWTMREAPAPARPSAGEPELAAAASVPLERPSPAQPLQAAAMPAPALPDRATSTSPLAFDGVAFLADFPRRLDALAARAQLGDAQAQNELADWLYYCELAASAADRRTVRPGEEGALSDPGIRAYFAEVGSGCKAWISRQGWLQPELAQIRDAHRRRAEMLAAGLKPGPGPREALSLSQSMLQQAARSGDALAQARSGERRGTDACGDASTMADSGDRRAQARCADQRLRLVLRDILIRRDPQTIEFVPQIVISYGTSSLNGSEFFQDFTLWVFAACHYGLNCGPTGRVLREACTRGLCGYRSFREYAADQLLSPTALRMIDSHLPRLLVLIDAADVDGILGPPPR